MLCDARGFRVGKFGTLELPGPLKQRGKSGDADKSQPVFALRATPGMRPIAWLRHAKPIGEAWWTGLPGLTINRRSQAVRGLEVPR